MIVDKRKGTMSKNNRGFKNKRLGNVNIRIQQGGDKICSPSNNVTMHNASGGSLKKDCDDESQRKEIYRGFQAKVEELRNETLMLRCDLRRCADSCMQLRRENKLLLDQLKQMCYPDVISYLEAKNPDQSPGSVDSQSDDQSPGSADSQSDDQSTESLTECNSSPDRNADAS